MYGDGGAAVGERGKSEGGFEGVGEGIGGGVVEHFGDLAHAAGAVAQQVGGDGEFFLAVVVAQGLAGSACKNLGQVAVVVVEVGLGDPDHPRATDVRVVAAEKVVYKCLLEDSRADNLAVNLDTGNLFPIFIDFENGVRARITADLWCYINEARRHVSGDDGTALIPKWFGAENEIVKSNIKTVNRQEGVLYTRNGLSRTMWPRPVTEVEKLSLPAPEPPRREEFYENLMLAVEGKAEQTVTHAQMRKVMRVIECGFESARTNQVVKFTL